MQIGRYLNAKRIMLGLAALGAAAAIACGSQEQQRSSIDLPLDRNHKQIIHIP